ncbi:MAG: hypothetical protein GY711_20045 [bacterium]|nr:hypothetical protein [bacterium]
MDRRIRERRWIVCASGFLLAAAGLGHRHPRPFERAEGPGPVRVWIADRGAHELVGLDDELMWAGKVHVPAPVAVLADPGGGTWVVSASSGTARGPHAILRMEPDGRMRAVAPAGPVLDAAVAGAGRIAWIEAEPRAVRSTDTSAMSGAATEIAGALRIAGPLGAGAESGEGVVVGNEAGELWLGRGEDWSLAAVAGGPIVDLAVCSRAGIVWAMSIEPRLTAYRVAADARLAATWSHALPAGSRRLAAVADRVWVFGRRRTALRYGPDGVRELELKSLPLAALVGAEALPSGETLLLAPDACLRLSADEQLIRGQGGFVFGVASARVLPNPNR